MTRFTSEQRPPAARDRFPDGILVGPDNTYRSELIDTSFFLSNLPY